MVLPIIEDHPRNPDCPLFYPPVTTVTLSLPQGPLRQVGILRVIWEKSEDYPRVYSIVWDSNASDHSQMSRTKQLNSEAVSLIVSLVSHSAMAMAAS